MNKLAEKLHSGIRDLKGKISEFVDNVDWNRVGTGILKGAGAAVILVIGVAAVVATGGAALPAVAGLLAGTVSAGTAIVTVATLAAGIASVSFGLADVLEALQDLSYGLEGSSKASFNPLRDTLFTGKEDLYYGLEMASTLIASAGTVTFRSFNMESEINASEIARYGKGGTLETGTPPRYENDITFESDNSSAPVINKRNTPDQDAVIQLAKEVKKNGGASYEDAEILIEWAKEYDVPYHEIEVHPNRQGAASNIPHFHIGRTGHIPIIGDIPPEIKEALYGN